MASFIQELENNEALLLMYFTDELPVDDRAEVEQMLASDAGMRAALAEIASAYSASMGVPQPSGCRSLGRAGGESRGPSGLAGDETMAGGPPESSTGYAARPTLWFSALDLPGWCGCNALDWDDGLVCPPK